MRGVNTLIVGLTGQTGAGKSTVAHMFARRGVAVIDADEVARKTMESSKGCLMDLVIEFSTEVIHPDATLNREKLAKICFGNPHKLKRLNQIAYPYIVDAIEKHMSEICARGDEMLVLDAPTLYESGLDKQCDRVVAVIAEKETRIRRIIRRDNLAEEDARLRADAQNLDTFYTARADDIIKNNEDEQALQQSFADLYARLRRMAHEIYGTPPQYAPDLDEERRGQMEELAGAPEAE